MAWGQQRWGNRNGGWGNNRYGSAMMNWGMPSWGRGRTQSNRRPASKPSGKPLPAGSTVDKTKRYEGTVISYRKWSGYGWVKMNETGIVPDDKVFVFWKSIQTVDRFPFLNQDLTVEFGLHPYKSKKAKDATFVRAKAVTLPKGAKLSLQDAEDAEKKTFVGGQTLRYTGTLKFFHKRDGFGYITMDDGYDLKGEAVPKEIRVESAEFNSGGKEPIGIRKGKDVKVEFGIWKTKKGQYKGYNMTLPKMTPITKEALEGRQETTGRMYTGTLTSNLWRQGYGFIEVEGTIPPQVTTKIQEMNAATKSKDNSDKNLYFRSSDIRDNEWLKKGQKVEFKIYTDEKGAGAMDIHSVA